MKNLHFFLQKLRIKFWHVYRTGPCNKMLLIREGFAFSVINCIVDMGSNINKLDAWYQGTFLFKSVIPFYQDGDLVIFYLFSDDTWVMCRCIILMKDCCLQKPSGKLYKKVMAQVISTCSAFPSIKKRCVNSCWWQHSLDIYL